MFTAVGAVQSEWRARVVAEYRSAALTHSLLGWLLSLGASPTRPSNGQACAQGFQQAPGPGCHYVTPSCAAIEAICTGSVWQVRAECDSGGSGGEGGQSGAGGESAWAGAAGERSYGGEAQGGAGGSP